MSAPLQFIYLFSNLKTNLHYVTEWYQILLGGGTNQSGILGFLGKTNGTRSIIALFGASSSISQLSKMNKDAFILLRWKSYVPHSHALWIQAVLNCIKLEKIRYTLKRSMASFVFLQFRREVHYVDRYLHTKHSTAQHTRNLFYICFHILFIFIYDWLV